jgi:hypothetical protein
MQHRYKMSRKFTDEVKVLPPPPPQYLHEFGGFICTYCMKNKNFCYFLRIWKHVDIEVSKKGKDIIRFSVLLRSP